MLYLSKTFSRHRSIPGSPLTAAVSLSQHPHKQGSFPKAVECLLYSDCWPTDPESQRLGCFADGSRTSYSHFYPHARPFPCPEGSWRKEGLWLHWRPVFASSHVFGTKDTAYAVQSKEKREAVLHVSESFTTSVDGTTKSTTGSIRDTDTCCHSVGLGATFTHAQQW